MYSATRTLTKRTINMCFCKHKHMVFILFVCFCLFLHKLASNMPGKNWAVTEYWNWWCQKRNNHFLSKWEAPFLFCWAQQFLAPTIWNCRCWSYCWPFCWSNFWPICWTWSYEWAESAPNKRAKIHPNTDIFTMSGAKNCWPFCPNNWGKGVLQHRTSLCTDWAGGGGAGGWVAGQL